MIEQQRSPDADSLSLSLTNLAAAIEQKIQNGETPTLEERRAAINALILDFFFTLRNPAIDRIRFASREFLNPVKYNNMVSRAISDVDLGYARINEAQSDIRNRTNKFVAFLRTVEDRVARANSVISSTSIINDIGVYETGDSFNDESRIDTNTVTAAAKMFTNLNAGLVTLPRSDAKQIPIEGIEILDASNGYIPDGFEIDSLTDGNLDTWFEYRRRVADIDDSTELTLILLLKIKLPTMINLIDIVPFNQDDKIFPRIESVATSIDGRNFQSITDSLPEFITKDEENALFTLGPVGFRNQAAAEFVLTPRLTRFIRVTIKQSKKTQEDNISNQIIALRDIRVQQIKYKDAGELLSASLAIPFPARKVILTERKAATEPLTTLAYQISFDGGTTFNNILPDEAIEINTGTVNAITVDNEKQEAKLKITAIRDSEKFTGLAKPLADTVRQVRERFSTDETPLTFSLINIPIEDSLEIFRPLAVIGFTNKGTKLASAQGADGLVVEYPVDIKAFAETVKVNGTAWTRVTDFTSTGPDDKHYTIDYSNRQVAFGNNAVGQVPQGDITIEIDPEQVVIPDTSPYEIELKYAHDLNREHIEVEWEGRPVRVRQEILARGANKFDLENTNIVEYISIEEVIPGGVNEFYLQYIPLDTDLEFSDKVTFATGQYSTNRLISSDSLSPLRVKLNSSVTTPTDPGTVTYKAAAKIINTATSYNAELWSTVGLEIYKPIFSRASVFSTEKTFVDGTSELTQAGDYSIDYENGIVYSFTESAVDGNSLINYSYRPERKLDWQFGDTARKLVIEDESVLVNKNDLDYAVVATDTGKYFIIFKDSRFIWLPFKDSYVTSANVEVDTTDLSAANRPLQQPTIPVEFTFVPADDFIRGQVLPVGRTRVSLPHSSLVKNSVRFISVSDDINAVDDRIVSKNTITNEITVSPKPVKDVYGNSLTGSTIGITTQRDLDLTALTREVPFENGKDELKSGGDYSIDYEDGVLYTFDSIPDHMIIQYEFSDISVSYIAHKQLAQGTEFDFDSTSLEVTVNDLGVDLQVPDGNLLAVYDIVENFAQDPAQIVNFYSPILYGYTLKISKD